MRKKTITTILTILFIQIGFTQDIDTLKLNNYFKTLDKNNKFMGSVALLKNGKIVYNNQIGFADIETKKKSTKNTKYRIGSISKTFTATLIFKAIEEGKINLNQTINRYFPTIKNSDSITIGNLLNHRSGIYNFTNDKEYLTYYTVPKSEEEMLSIISKYDSNFKPNLEAKYSNSNYVLLSFILQKIYKKTYAEILTEKIINNIDLKNTYFGREIDLKNNESYSYSYNKNWKKQPETNTSIPIGAGGITSTPNDLLQFSEALFNYKIISKKSLTKMETLEDNYGMGLFKTPFYDFYSFGHTGSIDGFSSVFGYFPEEKCAIALTSNGTNYDNNKISIVLLKALFNKPFTIPTFTTYVLNSTDLNTYLGVYSSPGFPLKITITKSENSLKAQATGQSSFPLEATEKDTFTFNLAGIILKFDTTNNKMLFKQGNATFELNKE
jgi:CubicO group peptidase (beta-lactamase class C family)